MTEAPRRWIRSDALKVWRDKASVVVRRLYKDFIVGARGPR